MARVYKSVCCEIDRLYIKILDLTEQQIKFKLELEKLMNNGFLNIAKARYIMGSTRVSMLQLPTEDSNFEIKALSTICRERCKHHDVFKLEIRKPSSPLTEYESSNDNQVEADTNKLTASVEERKESMVVSETKFQELKTGYYEDEDTDPTKMNEYSDPIKLFGVLVPFTLKIAQQFFKDSLFILVKCATIQSNLNYAINRHKYLLEIKVLVEKAAADRGLKLYSETDSEKLSSIRSESSFLNGKDYGEESAAEDQGKYDLERYFEDLGLEEENGEGIHGE